MNAEPKNYTLLRATALSLYQAVNRPISYLEIGVQEGGSAKAVMQSGVIGFAVLIDTWGTEFGGSGRGSPKHISELLSGFPVIIISGDSRSVLPMITSAFDLIFIDGDHSADGCLSDMANSVRLLQQSGAMLVDDINHPKHSYIKGVVEKFCDNHRLRWEHVNDAHFGVSVLKKS